MLVLMSVSCSRPCQKIQVDKPTLEYGWMWKKTDGSGFQMQIDGQQRAVEIMTTEDAMKYRMYINTLEAK